MSRVQSCKPTPSELCLDLSLYMLMHFYTSVPMTLGWTYYFCVNSALSRHAWQELIGVQHALLRRVLQAQVLPPGECAWPPQP